MAMSTGAVGLSLTVVGLLTLSINASYYYYIRPLFMDFMVQ